MKIEEVIGANIRKRRESLGYSQLAFGERVGPLLGSTWKPQTVSAAEKGRRQFIAAELVVLARVLRCRVQDLLTVNPPQPVQISEAFVQEADYSAPLENALDGAPLDLSMWLRPFSEAYREILAAQDHSRELREAVDEMTHRLSLAEGALRSFTPDDGGPETEWWGETQVVDDEDDSDAAPSA